MKKPANNNPYDIELSASKNKYKKREWIEPLILLVAILAYCVLMANREHDEQQVRVAEAQQDNAQRAQR